MATVKKPGRKLCTDQVEVGSPRDNACARDLVKGTCGGKIDWKTLANIIAADLLGEVLCASYADYKYGRRTKDFNPAIEWKFSYEESDILVFTKHHSSDHKIVSFMGRGVIDFPVSTVAAVLQNLENFKIWNKYMIESRLIELLSESDNHRNIIAYFLHETKRCLIRTKRDMVMFLHNSYTPDRFVQACISVDHPSCPAVNGITRAECCLGSGWVVETYEGRKSKSLVSLVCNIDMKGLIPPLILSRFLQRQPLAIHYLRGCVAEEARKHTPPAIHVRFSLRTDGAPLELSDHSTKDQEDKDHDGERESLNAIEFPNNALASLVYVNNASYKQYEDPVGISEFTGYNTAPRTKRRQRRRHRCCLEQGGGAAGGGGGATAKESFFSSGSCGSAEG